MKNIHYCKNFYGGKVEHCLLVEKGLTKRLIGAAAAVIALMTLYFII